MSGAVTVGKDVREAVAGQAESVRLLTLGGGRSIDKVNAPPRARREARQVRQDGGRV